LQELTDYLDSAVDLELRLKLERHISECPNCFVILDTTQKTIKVYKGVEPQEIPPDVHMRLMRAVERKMNANGSGGSGLSTTIPSTTGSNTTGPSTTKSATTRTVAGKPVV